MKERHDLLSCSYIELHAILDWWIEDELIQPFQSRKPLIEKNKISTICKTSNTGMPNSDEYVSCQDKRLNAQVTEKEARYQGERSESMQ